MTTSRAPVPGLHLWNPAQAQAVALAGASFPRLWLLPAVALLALALITATGANIRMFLAINAVAGLLPGGFWACVTSLGDTLPAFAILLPLVRRRPDAAAAALLAVLLAMFASQGLKHLLDLPRPAAVLDDHLFRIVGPRISGHSFPSGHATAAFTVAALVGGYSLPVRKWLPIVLGAAMIGLSRIAVGAHFPTDVLAGALIGWFAGFGGLHLAPYCRCRHSRISHGFTLALFAAGTLWLLTGFQSGYSDARWLERGVALAALLLFIFLPSGKRTPRPSPHPQP